MHIYKCLSGVTLQIDNTQVPPTHYRLSNKKSSARNVLPLLEPLVIEILETHKHSCLLPLLLVTLQNLVSSTGVLPYCCSVSSTLLLKKLYTPVIEHGKMKVTNLKAPLLSRLLLLRCHSARRRYTCYQRRRN